MALLRRLQVATLGDVSVGEPPEPTIRQRARSTYINWKNAPVYEVPARSLWSTGLARLRVVGLVFFALELVGFGWWSTVVVDSYSLSWDFAINLQAVYQMSHFHWAAHLSTFRHGVSFYQIHGVFMEFFLGMIYRLWASPLVLLWAQDVFIVAAQLMVFLLMVDFLARQEQRRGASHSALLAAIGLALLALDPWILWTVSFDYHSEPIGLFMVLLAARSLLKGQKRGFFFAFGTLLTGDVATTYLVGAGISLTMVARRYWRAGVTIALSGVMMTLLLAHFHFDKGSPVAAFNYLIGPHGIPTTVKPSPLKLLSSLIERPWRPLHVLWNRHVNIVANIAAPGLIGYFTPWTFAIPTFSLVLNALPFEHKNEFIVPFFQSLPDYVIVPLGTVMWLSYLTSQRSKRWRQIGWGVAVLVMVNALGWAIAWDGTTKQHWLPVTPAAAAELRLIQAAIPVNDEVICSQGVMGLMATRPWIYPLNNGRIFPQTSPTGVTWVVIAPEQGIEIQSSISAQQLVTHLAQQPNATLMFSAAGVYAFRVVSPTSATTLTLQRGPKLAWVDPGSAGTPVTVGPQNQWYLSANGSTGYVLAYDYFREPAGSYRAVVRLVTEGPLNLEVWDNSTDTMLARQPLTATGAPMTIKETFTLDKSVGDNPYSGFGPWIIHPTPGPPGDQLEVRAYTETGAGVKIYSVTIEKHSAP